MEINSHKSGDGDFETHPSNAVSHYSQTRQLIKISFGAAKDIRIAQLLAQTASKLVHPKKKDVFLSARTSEMGVKPFRNNIGPKFFFNLIFKGR